MATGSVGDEAAGPKFTHGHNRSPVGVDRLMSTRSNTMSPEPILRAALRTLFVASCTTRNWTLNDEVSREQINDLWEAIHEVADLLCRWREDAKRELLGSFDEYDEK